MAKLENSLKIDVTPIDSDIPTHVIKQAHDAINSMKGSVTHKILEKEPPHSIKLVSSSFPKPIFGDHKIHNNNILIWPDTNKDIGQTIKQVFPKIALSTIITRASKQDPIVDTTKEPNVIGSNYASQVNAQQTKIRNQRRKALTNIINQNSQELYEHKDKLSSGIRRRIKNPKGSLSPQLITFMVKHFGEQLVNSKGRPLFLHTSRLLRENPHLSGPINSASKLIKILEANVHKL